MGSTTRQYGKPEGLLEDGTIIFKGQSARRIKGRNGMMRVVMITRGDDGQKTLGQRRRVHTTTAYHQ